MEDSYQLEGLVAADILPVAWLGYKHPYFETPWGAIGLSLAFCLFIISFDFHDILAIDNCFSSAAALLEFFAFIKLRRDRPELFDG